MIYLIGQWLASVKVAAAASTALTRRKASGMSNKQILMAICHFTYVPDSYQAGMLTALSGLSLHPWAMPEAT